MWCQIGIRVDEIDVAGARAKHRGGHLTVRRHCSISHLSRANRKVIASIGQKDHDGAGTMLRRRAAIEPGKRHAGAFSPLLSLGFWTTPACGQGPVDLAQTLIVL